MSPTAWLIVVGGSFLLAGGLMGYIVGHVIGYQDGIEAEKQRQIEKKTARN